VADRALVKDDKASIGVGGFTVTHDLGSLDALHLAAALVLPGNDLVVAT